MEIGILIIVFLIVCICIFILLIESYEDTRGILQCIVAIILSIIVIVAVNYHRHIMLQNISTVVTKIEIINSTEPIYKVTLTKHHSFYSNQESTYITTTLPKLGDVVVAKGELTK